MANISAPYIFAHRGVSGYFPENTMAAFKAVVASAVNGVEFDVTWSKDRQLVVIHDDSLERTTNGRGPVCELNLLELKKLDAGSWKSDSFSTETIPTLAEVLTFFKHKPILVNIELKELPKPLKNQSHSFCLQVLQTVKELEMLDQCLISSFDWSLLETMFELNQAVKLAVLADKFQSTIMELADRINAWSLHISFKNFNAKHIAKIKKRKHYVFAYTINDPLAPLSSFGLDGIFTDYPTEMGMMELKQ